MLYLNVTYKFENEENREQFYEELYANNIECIDNVVNKGEFLVLYPEDGHMPGVCIGEQKQIQKAVIKVPVK